MFQQSAVLLGKSFSGPPDEQFGLVAGGLMRDEGPNASCCVLLLFSAVKGCAGPELKEATREETV